VRDSTRLAAVSQRVRKVIGSMSDVDAVFVTASRLRDIAGSQSDAEITPPAPVRRSRTPQMAASDAVAATGQPSVQRILVGDITTFDSTAAEITLLRFTIFERDGTFDAVVMRDGTFDTVVMRDGEFVVELHTTPTVYDDRD
jgi:hypothetical protein